MVAAALCRHPETIEEPRPALGVRGLEGVVVALDPGPDDEVGAEPAREVSGGDRAALGLAPHLGIGGAEAAAAEERVEVEPGRDAVDAVVAQYPAHRVEVVLGELLRVVELVVVDQPLEPVHRPPHPLRRGLTGPLRLVAARHEARHHGAQRPDAEARPHGAGAPSASR